VSSCQCNFREWEGCSVADPGCLSRIPDPDFYPPRIPDPKTTTKERGEKKFVVINFLCSHKFHKIANYFSFRVLKKKIWANFQRIIELFTQKIVTKLSKIWIWDPGSGKNLYRIPDPGVKKAPDPGSRSATLWECVVYLAKSSPLRVHTRIVLQWATFNEVSIAWKKLIQKVKIISSSSLAKHVKS
jgi:hypothetical protein